MTSKTSSFSSQLPVVLITGASRGLGLETARLFAKRGFPLILTAREAGALEKAASELRALHRRRRAGWRRG